MLCTIKWARNKDAWRTGVHKTIRHIRICIRIPIIPISSFIAVSRLSRFFNQRTSHSRDHFTLSLYNHDRIHLFCQFNSLDFLTLSMINRAIGIEHLNNKIRDKLIVMIKRESYLNDCSNSDYWIPIEQKNLFDLFIRFAKYPSSRSIPGEKHTAR